MLYFVALILPFNTLHKPVKNIQFVLPRIPQILKDFVLPRTSLYFEVSSETRN